MMKKQYETPELEVIVLEQSDIITTSGKVTGLGSANGTNQGKLDSWS